MNESRVNNKRDLNEENPDKRVSNARVETAITNKMYGGNRLTKITEKN